jgi:hypothetical protein
LLRLHGFGRHEVTKAPCKAHSGSIEPKIGAEKDAAIFIGVGIDPTVDICS